MLESGESGKSTPTAKSNVLPPSQFEVVEGKSIILATDIPHGTEPAGWILDGKLITNDGSPKEMPRFRAFERLLNGEASADYDCFLSRQTAAHHAPSTIRAYLAIDSTCSQDTGSYELLVRTKTNPTSPVPWAGANIRVVPSKTDGAKKRRTDGGLSSELPTVHYPHPMAPVFVRAFPDKVYIDAGDTVQLGCRLWGLPSNFVNWTTEKTNLLTKAS